jgi:HEAT repeat protein
VPIPPDTIQRAADLAALGLRSRLAPGAAAELEAALDDPEPMVRAAALAALVRAGGRRRAGGAWERAVADPAPAVRRRAAELAPTVGGSTTARLLIGLLGDEDVTVVDAAAGALGELGEVAVKAGAIGALAPVVTGHTDALAREAAVAALGALGDPAGLAAILTACTDKPAVRRRAVLALAPFDGPEVDAALEHALQDRDWQTRQAAEDLRN